MIQAGHISLVVAPEGWGAAPVADLERLLASVAFMFAPSFFGQPPERLRVEHASDVPRAVYVRAPDGSKIIHLTPTGTYWSQFSYQFAHELCHVLCHYERPTLGQERVRWFEESLCEMASLYALRRMAVTWPVSPPYENWKPYAPSLAGYAQDFIGKVPVPPRFPAWFKQNEKALEQNAALRDKNAVVAVQLLPLVEKDPRGWGAVSYLYAEPYAQPKRFATHLQEWHARCPKTQQKAFVKQVAERFAIPLR